MTVEEKRAVACAMEHFRLDGESDVHAWAIGMRILALLKHGQHARVVLSDKHLNPAKATSP